MSASAFTLGSPKLLCSEGSERNSLLMGTLIIRIGFRGPLYYNYKKESTKIVLTIKAPTVSILKPYPTTCAGSAMNIS